MPLPLSPRRPAFSISKIRRLLKQSLSIDPNFARSHAMLANACAIAWLNPLDCDFLRPETLEEALRHACKAVQLDPNLPDAHAYLGFTLTLKHRHEASLGAFQRLLHGIRLLPWRFGLALVYAGNPSARSMSYRIICSVIRSMPFGLRLPRLRILHAKAVLRRAGSAARLRLPITQPPVRPYLAGCNSCAIEPVRGGVRIGG